MSRPRFADSNGWIISCPEMAVLDSGNEEFNRGNKEMISTLQMIRKLEGMVDTKDLNEWENEFVKSMVVKADAGEVTKLTEKQIDRLVELHNKHFR